MEYYLKLFRNHEEYEEYKREHPEPAPKPPYIPPIPLPSHVIKYVCARKVDINRKNFDANLMVHDFKHGVGTILFDNRITIIGDSVFIESDITSIEIPDSVTSIGNSAFASCSGLTSITVNAIIPPSLGYSAFHNTNDCPIYVPNESVDDYKTANDWVNYADRIQPIDPSYEARWVEIDSYCEDYSLYVEKKLQLSYDSGATWEDTSTTKSVMKEYHSASCGYEPISKMIRYNSASKLVETTSNKDTGLHTNAFNSSITSHTFSNGGGEIGFENDVTSVGSYAFYNCGITNIEMPNSVTSIGNSVFYNCNSLTSIDIPSGVTSIGDYAFTDCTSLTSIVIPDSVTSIGDYAFTDCTSLTSITVNAITPPSLGYSTFGNTNNCPIYVPAESVEAYKTATNWSSYASRIQAIQ